MRKFRIMLSNLGPVTIRLLLPLVLPGKCLCHFLNPLESLMATLSVDRATEQESGGDVFLFAQIINYIIQEG